MRRIIDRLAPFAAVESLLVLDASPGQNGLRQAMAFASAAWPHRRGAHPGSTAAPAGGVALAVPRKPSGRSLVAPPTEALVISGRSTASNSLKRCWAT